MPSDQHVAAAGGCSRRGMGEVLRVVDPEIGRELAAKVIRGATDRAKLGKFILEAQVTGRLRIEELWGFYLAR